MCSTINELRTEKLTDSDMNHTMLASRTFDDILKGIQSSNLNFQMQVSPFSAQISIKKSLVKDSLGFIRLPPSLENQRCESVLLENENQKLRKDLEALRQDYKQRVDDLSEANNKISFLEESLNKPIKTEINHDLLESLTHKVSSLAVENEGLRVKIKEKDDEIDDLQNNIKVKVKLSEKLNKELNETKTKAGREKAAIAKIHKAEIKSLKKDIGEERKQTKKLEKKLENELNDKHAAAEMSKPYLQSTEHPSSSLSPVLNQISCSICAQEIINYKPKYFLGEVFNPACSDCDDSFEGDDSGPDGDGCTHTPQCVLRQPIAPPTISSVPASMVAHWIPETNMNNPVSKNPSSITSLITHCVKLPNPGDSFLSMEEILQEIREMFKNMWKIN